MQKRSNIKLLYLIAFFGSGYFEHAIWILYLIGKGYSMLQIGWAQAIINITMLITQIPTGMIADRYGRKKSLVIGRALIILYYIMMMTSASFYMIDLAFMVLGAGSTFISAAEDALLYDSLKKYGFEKDSSKIIGRYMAILTVALALAMAAGGFLQKYSWNFVFLLSIIFQAAALTTCLLVEEITLDKRAVQNFSHLFKNIKQFFTADKTTAVFVVGVAIFWGVIYTYYMYSQKLFNQMGIGIYYISLIFGMESLLAAAISTTAHIFEKKYSPGNVMSLSLAIIAVFFLILMIKINALIIVAFFIIGNLLSLLITLSYNVANKCIQSAQRATLLSVMNFLTSLVMSVLFPLVGYLSGKTNIYFLLGTVGFISMAISYLCINHFFKNISGKAAG